MADEITIYLKAEDIERLKRYRKYDGIFSALDELVESGILKNTGGQYIINLAKGGIAINAYLGNVQMWKKQKLDKTS